MNNIHVNEFCLDSTVINVHTFAQLLLGDEGKFVVPEQLFNFIKTLIRILKKLLADYTTIQ